MSCMMGYIIMMAFSNQEILFSELESTMHNTVYFVLLYATLMTSPASAECELDTKSLTSVAIYCLNEFSSIATNNYAIDCSTGRTQAFMKCLAFSGNCGVQRELPSIISAAMTSYYTAVVTCPTLLTRRSVGAMVGRVISSVKSVSFSY